MRSRKPPSSLCPAAGSKTTDCTPASASRWRDASSGAFAAVVAGFEHTFYGVGDSAVDIGQLVELLYDGRGQDAPPTLFTARLLHERVMAAEALSKPELAASARARLAEVQAQLGAR